MSPELLTTISVIASTAIGTGGVLVGKKWESRTITAAKADDNKTSSVALALDVLQEELTLKGEPVSSLQKNIEGQSRQISELRVANWLVLEHLLQVHRHFAEGNPPPPPPSPDKLLAHLSGNTP